MASSRKLDSRHPVSQREPNEQPCHSNPLYRQRLRDALRQGMAAGYQRLIRLAHHRRGWQLLGWTA